MCEQDAPDRVEGACGRVVGEQAVVIVDVLGGGAAALPDIPVARVVLPHDRLQPKCIRDRANAVLHTHTKNASASSWALTQDSKHAYVDISVGRAPTGHGNAGGELDGLDLGEESIPINIRHTM